MNRESDTGSERPFFAPRFDPSHPDVLRDPYGAYAALRTAGPICRAGPAQWAVTRYADVAAFLEDPRLRNCFPQEYHRLAVGDGPAAEFMQRILLYHDAPVHARLRRMLGRSFDAPALRALRVRVSEIVESIVAPALEDGRLEVVSDLALPLPIRVVCHILGLPADDWRHVRPKAADLGRAFRVAEALKYGMVGINTGLVSTEVAPFGGMKESGIGREGSKYGIEEFIEVKYLCMGGI